ncbi:hypothetical protein AWB82_04408 [Caballeronia glebae]|uniref:Uncharacterized protein n=1 Tax=Caballeronia glebae TaxID=1777143 RepID=A0A158BSC4_9BURK|nr:hypothetical protein AWB82_04408 [Caballeronia glebae]
MRFFFEMQVMCGKLEGVQSFIAGKLDLFANKF